MVVLFIGQWSDDSSLVQKVTMYFGSVQSTIRYLDLNEMALKSVKLYIKYLRLSQPRVHIAMLDTPEDASSTMSETLGPSPFETPLFSEE